MTALAISIELLPKIKTPLANKFFDLHSARGRANKQDDIWVVRHQSIIIAACRIQYLMGEHHSVLFLSTVMVSPEYRKKGIARKLLCFLLKSYHHKIITFAYQDLTAFYLSVGFKLTDDLNKVMQQKFIHYCKQGRKLIPMEY